MKGRPTPGPSPGTRLWVRREAGSLGAVWRLGIRAYPVAALIAAAFLTPPLVATMPFLALCLHIYLLIPRKERHWSHARVLTDYLIYFMLVAIFQQRLSLLAILIALPLLGALTTSLGSASQLAAPDMGVQGRERRLTPVCLTIIVSGVLILITSFALGGGVMASAALASLAYVSLLLAIVIRSMRAGLLSAETVKLRIVAGTDGSAVVRIRPRSAMVRKARLVSPYGWLKVAPEEISPHPGVETIVTLTMTPPLSGPARITLQVQAIDRYGLIETGGVLSPVELFVIPRARYASWVAKRYLAGMGTGVLPLFASGSSLQGAPRSITGLDYYGSRRYQPGDDMHSIDWKHSVKFGHLVTKEFTELKGRPALMLVNLSVSGPEEADDLAYRVIAMSLFLAKDRIPGALAAYDHGGVKLTTATLQPSSLVAQSLSLAQHLVEYVKPAKYLAPPDVHQLQSNLFRLRKLENETARALAAILQIEFRSLDTGARHSPATTALLAGLGKAEKGSSLVFISQGNHDADALAFNTSEYRRRGHVVIEV